MKRSLVPVHLRDPVHEADPRERESSEEKGHLVQENMMRRWFYEPCEGIRRSYGA